MPAKKTAAKKTETMPVRKAAEVVLLEAGRPMHYREVTRQVIERGLIKVRRGHKDEQTLKTVRSFLAGEAQLPEGRVVRVDPGVFDLKERAAAAVKAAAKKKKPAARKAAAK